MKRRNVQKPLSNNWLDSFLRRWSDRLKSINPRSLESTRAKGSTPEVIDKYYQQLDEILIKYDLKSHPECIYNLDETGLQPNHTPPNIIGPVNTKAESLISPKSSTTTLIGCVNAIGNSLPPYFIFKGKRYNPLLMEGASAGSKANMSDSGWSNLNIFENYLREHFLPYAKPTADRPVLLLYDGHSSHVSPNVINWARSNNIILFVLPPHTSHLLQPLDVAVFGPLKKFYNHECAIFMRYNLGKTINKYYVAELGSKAYTKAMTPANIQAAFKKTGIFPFNTQVVEAHKLYPAEAFREVKSIEKVKALKKGKEEVEKFLKEKTDQMQKCEVASFDKKTKIEISHRSKKPSPGGTAITEKEFTEKLEDYENNKSSSKCKLTKRQDSMSQQIQSNKCKHINSSPKPSTSGINNSKLKASVLSSDEEFVSDDDDNDKCVVCKRSSPEGIRELPYLVIVKWVQCSICSGWVHLKFCTPESFIRQHAEYTCPICNFD